VLYTPDIVHIKNQLYNLYFSVFQLQENHPRKIDESVLLTKYKKLLHEYAKQEDGLKENARFRYNYTVKSGTTSEINFDVAWQDTNNLHLVKPISFDLSRSKNIDNKAFQYYGEFAVLGEQPESKDYLFDVILAKPKSKSLFSAYDNAIKILQKPKKVKLVEFEELKSYSKATAESALL
jgi:hypothetical protein